MGRSFSISFFPTVGSDIDFVELLFRDVVRIERPQVFDGLKDPFRGMKARHRKKLRKYEVASFADINKHFLSRGLLSGSEDLRLAVSIRGPAGFGSRLPIDVELIGKHRRGASMSGQILMSFDKRWIYNGMIPSQRSVASEPIGSHHTENWELFVLDLLEMLEPAPLEHAACDIESGWGAPWENSVLYHRDLKEFLYDVGRIVLRSNTYSIVDSYVDARPYLERLAARDPAPDVRDPSRWYRNLDPSGGLATFLDNLDEDVVRKVVSLADSVSDDEVAEVLAEGAKQRGSYAYYQIGNGGVIVTQPHGSVFRAFEFVVDYFSSSG